jgi:hypothetical protein
MWQQKTDHQKRIIMEELSNCCGASRWGETDVCSDCKEHADFYNEEE